MTAYRIVESFDFSAHRTLSVAAAEGPSQLVQSLFAEGKGQRHSFGYGHLRDVAVRVCSKRVGYGAHRTMVQEPPGSPGPASPKRGAG